MLSRRKKLMFNMLSSMTYQILVIVCGFILPRMYLVFFGSAVNGLVNSISNFLGFITLAECGVGAVVESAFYKPLADGDNTKISAVFASSNRFFNKIGLLLVAYVCVLVAIFPVMTDGKFGFIYTTGLILAISISSFSQYFFGLTYGLLLRSDQRGFIVNTVNSSALVLNTIISVVLMYVGASVQIVKLIASLIFLCKPLVLKIYVERRYHIDKKIVLTEEPIKQKWNGMAQHIASVVLNKTDVVVLTLFSSLENVSIYTVYHLVVAGLMDLVQAVVNGVSALFGNLLAKNEKEKLEKAFGTTEWLIHTGSTLAFTLAGMLIVPFVNVYTKGVTDVNYSVPVFAAIITLAQGVRSLRLPYNMMVLAAGHYKQTQLSAVIEAAINVIVSVVVVIKYGLVGVAVGTLAAMTYRTCYLAWYLSKNILNRSLKHYIIHCVVDAASCLIMIITTKWLIVLPDNYLQWIVLAIKTGLICAAECAIINAVVYPKELKALFRQVKR